MLVDEKGSGSASPAAAEVPGSSLKQVPWSCSPQRYRDTSRMIHFYLKQADPPPATPTPSQTPSVTPEPVKWSDVSDSPSSDEEEVKKSKKTRRERGYVSTKRMSLRSVTLRRRRSRALSKSRK